MTKLDELRAAFKAADAAVAAASDVVFGNKPVDEGVAIDMYVDALNDYDEARDILFAYEVELEKQRDKA